MTNVEIAMITAKINIGFAILLIPIPHDLITVISEDKLNLFKTITVAKSTPIGMDKTIAVGKFKSIMINAILNGTPNCDICLIKVMNVSDANMIVEKTNTPIKNITMICFKRYLSNIFILLYCFFKN